MDNSRKMARTDQEFCDNLSQNLIYLLVSLIHGCQQNPYGNLLKNGLSYLCSVNKNIVYEPIEKLLYGRKRLSHLKKRKPEDEQFYS